MDKVLSTLISVGVTVALSLALWVGANVLFDQARNNWRRFNAVAGAVVGFVLLSILHGNRLLVAVGPGPDAVGTLAAFVWPAALGAATFGSTAWYLSGVDGPRHRLIAGIATGTVVGVVVGALLRSAYRPGFDLAALAIWTAALSGLGALISTRRGRPAVHGALVGAALGSLLGGFGSAELGAGNMVGAIAGATFPAAAFGARIGLTNNADERGRARIDSGSRAYIFLVPSLFFITAALVVPTIRTIYLSFLDDRSENWVGIGNYTDVFTSKTSFDISNWPDIFTSRLFYLGTAMLIAGLAVAISTKKRDGRAVELGGPSIAPLAIAAGLLVFATFSVLRGTIMNNLWWVFTVTVVSTALGLAIAVLADNTRFESVAKALIFMPMAISLVGASIIWRFMFIARDSSKNQTGVLNSAWVGLGRLSTGRGIPTLLASVALGIVFLALAVKVARLLTTGKLTSLPIPMFALFLVGWAWVRFVGLVGDGLGGVVISSDGEVIAKPVLFVQEQPFNSVWLMLILIWIQTGFAMVILSAAIKAVPAELLEAAQVDGATESQVFWRVVLPQIATTIGVVVTTLIVLVMKVFDIVKVVTNGNFGTDVLANDFFAQAFQFANRGRGAALAVILFLSVLPVMYFNIRKMQQEDT